MLTEKITRKFSALSMLNFEEENSQKISVQLQKIDNC